MNLPQELRDFLLNILTDKDIDIREKGKMTVRPGDIVLFKYYLSDGKKISNHQRSGLIVSTLMGHGIYESTRGNLLMSCFKIHLSPPEIVKIVLKNLYKNEAKCNYHKITRALIQLFGKKQYRTYKVRNVNRLVELRILPKKK